MPSTGGEVQSKGEVGIVHTARSVMGRALEQATQDVTISRMKRAWLTAVQQSDGTVLTEIHAVAEYSHRGEIRECHHSFEIANDQEMEQAFANLFAVNVNAVTAAVLKDAALCHVMAEQGSDLSEEQRAALAEGK